MICQFSSLNKDRKPLPKKRGIMQIKDFIQKQIEILRSYEGCNEQIIMKICEKFTGRDILHKLLDYENKILEQEEINDYDVFKTRLKEKYNYTEKDFKPTKLDLEIMNTFGTKR